jgi:DNA-binding MarR family transcriptional regulator
MSNTAEKRRKSSRQSKSASTIAMDGLRRIFRALRQADALSRGVGGLPSAQLFVLRQIGLNPDSSVTALCGATLTSQSSVSEVVARLETSGLVHRGRDDDDTRRAKLSITATGRKLLDDSPQPFQERLVAALHRLSTDDQRALARGMSAWLREAGIADAPAPMFFEPHGRSAG